MLIAFPLKQWLYERASMLRYAYIACLVLIMLSFSYHFRTKRFSVDEELKWQRVFPCPRHRVENRTALKTLQGDSATYLWLWLVSKGFVPKWSLCHAT